MSESVPVEPHRAAPEPLAWIDGRIVSWPKLTVHASALGTAQSSSCFEGLRGYWSESHGRLHVFRLGDHVRRLQQSMKILRFRTPYGAEELERAVIDLLSEAGWAEDVYLRILAFESADVAGTFAVDAIPSILITAAPRASKLLTGGTKSCSVSSWRRISDNQLPPRVKAIANYLNSRYAYLQAVNDGYDDAIMLDQSDHVAESSAACLFIVRDGVPITSPVSSDILESITRDTLIELIASELDVVPVQREIDRTELYIADEIFLCGTGGGEVTPVPSVDGYEVGTGEIGPVTARIQLIYSDVVRARRPDRSGWLTSVAKVGAAS